MFNRRQISTLLAPKNKIQRIGLFFGLATFCILLFLHNPFSGYLLTYEPSYLPSSTFEQLTPSEECRVAGDYYNQTSSEGASLEKLDPIMKRMQELDCFGRHLLAFEKWESNSPINYWLGSVAHLLWTTFIVFCITIAWLVIFRSTDLDE